MLSNFFARYFGWALSVFRIWEAHTRFGGETIVAVPRLNWKFGRYRAVLLLTCD